MLTALIMAGGRGTRFWPASTEDRPKQFLSLTSENTMIQETVRRLLPLIDMEHIFICTGARYKSLCLEQLPDLPERNVIVEPVGRNTAPCILLSTLYISQIYPNSNIIVLPSDAMVTNETEQLAVFKDADKFIGGKDGIITIGIKPSRPETGYGYIQFADKSERIGTHEIKDVISFKEKPDVQTAEKYVADGHYLWNAGMFMFGAEFMKSQYAHYAKETYNILTSLPSISSQDYMEDLGKKYPLCESISVDFAIMEKTDKLYVVPADFGWDDVGSWTALGRYLSKGESGNITKGEVKSNNSTNNVVFSSTKPVILLDAENLFVIETEERIVVGNRESLSKVHELRNKYMNSTTDHTDPMIKLAPALKDYIWGGNQLKVRYGIESDLDVVAEAWVLSAHSDGESIVASGKHKGLPFSKYIETVGKSVLGGKCSSLQSFPILIKFIDANRKLSIQVHPDDDYALEHENQYGKNEMWYVVDAKPGAGLYIGFSRDVDREEVRKRIEDNTITEILNFYPTKPGDAFFIPAGTPHAICEGNLICEIQQSSNCTYRLYDYDRRDKFGNPRQLHLEKALDVLNYKKFEAGKGSVSCKYFENEVIDVEEKNIRLNDSSFLSLVVIDGEGQISIGDYRLEVKAGDSIFVPAQNGNLNIKGKMILAISHI